VLCTNGDCPPFPGGGLVEVALHPAEPAPPTSPADWIDGWHDPLAASRPNELRMLISDELPAMLERSGWQLGRLQHLAV
jgi:hypothetical protein